MRLAVERLTGFQDIPELAHGFAAARHRPKVALIDDPLHVFFRRSANPDGDGVFEQQGQRFGIRGQTAAGLDDRRCVLGQHSLQALAFEAPVTRLPVQLQNLADGRSVLPFDFAVEFEERHSSMLRQPAAERGLAGAAQSQSA